ncbi:hypothetical protein BKA83DRAFT_4504007 [Pisolithus microcarpus]|nr:hypothetical protein BKA83DRAFT_4504007 [Pisolithus microcarpus]
MAQRLRWLTPRIGLLDLAIVAGMIGGVADAFTLEIVIMQRIVMEDGGGDAVEMAFATTGDCAEANF